MGNKYLETAGYFNDCRVKRNITEYCDVGTISEKEANKLIQEVISFKKDVLAWIKKHPL